MSEEFPRKVMDIFHFIMMICPANIKSYEEFKDILLEQNPGLRRRVLEDENTLATVKWIIEEVKKFRGWT